MLSLHSRIAIVTLLPLMIWGAYELGTMKRDDMLPRPIDIGVEHLESASLILTHSMGMPPLFVDVQNDGQGDVLVSLPDTWQRKEVRNVPLASVFADEPMLGFRRWHLPAGGTVSFVSTDAWVGMMIHNSSTTPLKLRAVAVDVANETRSSESYLLSDEPMFIP